MTLEEMQSIISQMLQVQNKQQERHLQHQSEMDELQRQQQERHLQHELEMTQLRENLAKTEAIANSNARAIEASTNAGAETRQDLARLVNIVADITQATNRRLELLESK